MKWNKSTGIYHVLRPHVALLLLIIIGLIWWYPFAWPPEGQIINSPDVAFLYYFHQVYLQRHLPTHLPLWCPYYSCGFPYQANPQTAVCYPLSFVFAPLPVARALGLLLALHSIMAALGAYLLARSFQCSRGAALLAGVIFGYAGFVIAHCYAGHLAMIRSVAYMPLVYYCYRRALGFEHLQAAEFSRQSGKLSAVPGESHGPSGALSTRFDESPGDSGESGASSGAVSSYPSDSYAWFASRWTGKPVAQSTRSTRRGWSYWSLAGGGALALQVLAGHPQMAFYTILLLGLEGLTHIWRGWSVQRGRAYLLRVSAALSLLLISATLLAAVQLLPSGELVLQGERVQQGVEFAGCFAYPLPNCIQLLFPKLEGPQLCQDYEYEFFVGALPLLLAFWGALASWSLRQRSLLIIALFSVVLALGPATPLFTLLCHCLPGVTLFRAHTRALVMFSLALAVLAGIGADRFSSRKTTRQPWQVLVWLLFTGTLLAAAYYTRAGYGYSQAGRPGWEAYRFVCRMRYAYPALTAAELDRGIQLLWLAILFFVCGNWSHFSHGGRILFWLSLVLFHLYLEQSWRLALTPTDELIFATEFEKHLPAEEQLVRIWAPDLIFPPNRAILLKIYNVNGDSPMWVHRFLRFVHFMTQCPIPRKYIHTVNPQAFRAGPFPFKIFNVKYAVVRDPLHQQWRLLQNPQPLARAWVVHAITVAPEEEHQLALIKQPRFDPRKVALVRSPLPGLKSLRPEQWDQAQLSTARVQITDYQTQQLRLIVQLERPGLLVLSELDYPGWRVYVDGQPAQAYCADYLLRAVPLSAGVHQVVWCFEPTSFQVGTWISLVSLLLLGGLLLRHLACQTRHM